MCKLAEGCKNMNKMTILKGKTNENRNNARQGNFRHAAMSRQRKSGERLPVRVLSNPFATVEFSYSSWPSLFPLISSGHVSPEFESSALSLFPLISSGNVSPEYVQRPQVILAWSCCLCSRACHILRGAYPQIGISMRYGTLLDYSIRAPFLR